MYVVPLVFIYLKDSQVQRQTTSCPEKHHDGIHHAFGVHHRQRGVLVFKKWLYTQFPWP